jgi:LuxR family maltose regulon positive regulatory protein
MIRMHAVKGRAETCATLRARLDGVFSAFPQATTGLAKELLSLGRAIAAAYVATARRDWIGVQQELATAAPLADQLRRGRDAIEIKLLKALALRSIGADGSALLREAAGLADAYGLRRLLLDVHPELAAWSDELAGRGSTSTNPVPLPSDRSSASGARPAARSSTSPRVSPSALLTPKERDVLQLLGRRLSNKQIASALDVGDATVKWHLKNLFSKLGAGTREHALQRARMLGILEGI